MAPVRNQDREVTGIDGIGGGMTKQRRAERALRASLRHLRQSEERFRALADHLPVVFWMTDATSGRLLYVSSAYESLFGRPISPLFEEPGAVSAGIHPDDRPLVRRLFDGRRHASDLEYRIVRPEGSIRWVRDVSYPIVGSDGEPPRFGGIITDITALKASEQELARANATLRESEGRFREMAEHVEAVFWLVEPETSRLLYVSPQVTDILGLKPEEIAADPETFWRAIHPEDRERARAVLEAPTEDVEIEYRLVKPDGTVIWVDDRCFPFRDADGRVHRLAGIATDVTARHEQEAERALLGAAIEQTRDGMILFAPDGRAIYANAAYEQITGIPVDGLIGSYPLNGLSSGDEQALGKVFASLGRGEAWSGAIPLTRADGAVQQAELTVWPLTDQDGKLQNTVVVLRDVTALHDATQALAREQTERASIAASLAALRPRANLQETASAVVAEVLRLTGVTAASVVGFGPGGRATVIAAAGPDGMPVAGGLDLPAARAAFLRSRAGVTPGPLPFEPREEDGEMGLSWQRLGTTAMGWVPLQANGDPAGIIAVASSEPNGLHVLEHQFPALREYGAIASALLVGQLAERSRREETRARIGAIIADRAFHAVYQPVVELGSGTVVGYEMLTRFDDHVAPDLHFADAISAGLGLELEIATLEAAESSCLNVPERAWISLNVSPALVLEGRALRRLLKSCGRRLVLELTEHVAIEDYARLRRAVGVLNHDSKIAVDDAGAGFASLRHIIELRPDFVKLDIGLIRGVDSDPARQSMVAGMAHFAATTGCVLIAEGIETEAERSELRRLGILFGQGFLFGRPTPIEIARA